MPDLTEDQKAYLAGLDPAIVEAATDLRHSQDPQRFTLADGREIIVRVEPDPDYRLEDDGDWFGRLVWEYHHPRAGSRSQRPDGFDGAARKIETRQGPGLWWQPPADLKGDMVNLAKMEARIRDYFHEGWGYVGIVAEFGGETASLWAVESDADVPYLCEIIENLIIELPAQTPEQAAWLEGWKAGMVEAIQSIECCGDVDERCADLYEYVKTGTFPERAE